MLKKQMLENENANKLENFTNHVTIDTSFYVVRRYVQKNLFKVMITYLYSISMFIID